MITLQDIFLDLEDGELNQFSLTGEIDGPKGITPDLYPSIIRAINLGLTDLHTKLVIKEREVTINLFEGLPYYSLDSRYSIHNVDRKYMPKFIQDPPDPMFRFNDDLIQIRSVMDERGVPMSLNDGSCGYSAMVVNFNTLQFCDKIHDDNSAVSVVYQANHERIPTDAPLTYEVRIPEYLREALYAFVVHRVLMRSQSQEQVSVAQAFKMKYDSIIQSVTRLNSLSTQDSTRPIKFQKAGWV